MEKCDEVLLEVKGMERLERKIDNYLVEWKKILIDYH